MLPLRQLLGLTLFGLTGCGFAPLLCEPCDGGCGVGLTCEQNVCVSDGVRCGLRRGCGDGPECGEGFECFEGSCRTPVEVQVGSIFACARWPSGRVSCWGQNRYGNAGGAEELTLMPTEIPGVDDAVQLSLGWAFGCVLRESGQASCWGANDQGQLGDFESATLGEAFRSSPTPVDVFIPARVVKIDAAGRRACALDEGGRLYCWGAGGRWVNGALEACLLGDTVPNASQIPVLIPHERPLRDLVVGASHTLVREEDGTVLGFGSNAFGQLRAPPGPAECSVTEVDITPARAVSAGWEHSCGLDEAGSVHCTGTTDHNAIHSGRFELEDPAVDIRSNAFVSCVHHSSGNVSCWGQEDEGRLGHLMPADRNVGGAPRLVAGAEGTSQLSVGVNATCIVKDGDGLYCWGAGGLGQLGNGRHDIRTPSRILEGDFRAVSAGHFQSCAVAADGQVYCWGQNRDGGVGRGFRSYAEGPAPIPDFSAIDVKSGMHFVCALDTEAQVHCWGRYEPLSFNISDSPVNLSPAPVSRASGVRQLMAGGVHACAIMEDRTVRCWGYDGFGGVTGQATGRFYAQARTVPGVADVVELVMSISYTCAVHGDRTLTCWGDTGFNTGADVQDLTRLTGGAAFVCGRTTAGEAQCWGQNEQGQLGDGSTRPALEPRPVLELGAITDIQTMFAHACALEEGGRVYCWGQDLYAGRLGVGATHDRVAPVLVGDLPAVHTLDVGRDGACAIADDGVYCWGAERGAVSGSPVVTPTPTRVIGLR